MKKIIFTLSLAALALSAQAQYQIPNSDFETWNNTNEPGNGWYSFVSARTSDLGFLGSAAISQSKGNTTKTSGRGDTGYAAHLISKSTLIGAKANGNLTSGKINMGNTDPGDSKNYNFTDRSGSNHAILTGHPDAFEYWAKFKRGENGDYNARCHVILHGEVDYKDPSETDENINTYKIAEATVFATPCTTWTKFSGEFEYATPTAPGDKTYVLASFTTNPTAGGSAGDEFDIDDVRLIYYSQLKSLTVNGVSVPSFDKDTYNYTVDAFYTSSTSVVAVDNTKKGVATINVNPSESYGYNETTAEYTIKVTNEEGTEYHIYTIQFKDSGLSDLKYNGATLSGFSESTTSYSLSSEFFDATKLDYTPKGSATATHSYNEATGLLTITVTGTTSVTYYTIQFNDATLSDLSYDNTTLSDFSASNTNYNLSIDYDKTKVDYTVNGSASATHSFDYETGVLTITVTGVNATTNYTIQFNGPLAILSKPYTEDLYVTVDGQTSDKQDANVMVQTLNNGKINFVLKNFILGGMMPIGNIAVEGIEVAADNTFYLEDVIQIAAGDPSVSSAWYGPMLPPVPLKLKGKFISDSHVAVSIDIDMTTTLGQMVNVHLGYNRYTPSPIVVNTTAQYGTFCAPFAVTIPDGVQAYTVPSQTGGLLNLTELTQTIPANTPVLLFAENGYSSSELFGYIEGEAPEKPKVGLLTGVYTDTPAPVGSYVLQNLNGKVGFYQVETGQQPTVKANRCYLTTTSNNIKAFYFDEDDATGISLSPALSEGEGVIYNVAGQRMSKMQKGINIINGKKILK